MGENENHDKALQATWFSVFFIERHRYSLLTVCITWMLAGRPFFSGISEKNSSELILSTASFDSRNCIRRALALDRSSDLCCCRCFRRTSTEPLPSSCTVSVEMFLLLLLCFGDRLGVELLEEWWERLGDSNKPAGSSSMLDDFIGLCFHVHPFRQPIFFDI